MSAYDMVGKNLIQIKLNTRCNGSIYKIGDSINLEDGLYIGYEGWFIVEENIITKEGSTIFNKWGDKITTVDILDPKNPVCKCIDKIDKKTCCSHKNIDILLLNNLI